MAILEYFGSFDMLQYCARGKHFDDERMRMVNVGDFLTVLLSVDDERVEGIRLSSLATLLERAGCTPRQNPSLVLLVEMAIQGNSIDQRIERMVRRFVQGMVIPAEI